ncbi:dipeptidase PepV [Lottiidibacillus patelloidae]|uniref:Dipeptidase PepV n=1 Tax=Lottiidibacillus patelloidae TaxID=2670334 RepID=A0A263BSE3_9BACI|nr:dipeptidase PepV [Lottiidibacillus patelloidae]OZM56106.1 dipeptidase PepV [Lottiidibacillus patelloidae]
MTAINWNEEVLKRKEIFIKDIQQFLQIKSVMDEDGAKEGAPFGEGIQKALEHMLEKGNSDGFSTKNVDGYAGHIEFGQGEDLLGILCHVDVVPEGDGWTSDPYSAEIRDGKIYARGAIDDKGPTIAAYYAMKIVKELGLPLSKRVRMILGTDEESNWRCVDYYFEREEMPTIGFAPDADFPIINAEKGICDYYLVHKLEDTEAGPDGKLLSFDSGRRLNMVPDFAKAQVKSNNTSLQEQFQAYITEKNVTGKSYYEEESVHFELKGISAHGMEPNNGKNAGLILAEFLATLDLDKNGEDYIAFLNKYLVGDSRGVAFGVAVSDDISGPLTMNVGVMSYNKDIAKIGINMRSPVTHDVETTITTMKKHAKDNGYTFEIVSEMKPHYVEESHSLVQTLQRVYEEQTSEKANLIAIGGGTYARSLKAGVAFGPMFPGSEDVAHQKDEYVIIEDLLKATAIYAQAIYELAK